MSLDVSLYYKDHEIFSKNITHNLGQMANKAGCYYALWRPEEIGIKKAKRLIIPLEKSLLELKNNPEKYKEYNPKNGWGSYEGLIDFIIEYLEYCKKYPACKVYTSR